MKKAVAIITARGGSKRIPRKNILPFLGRPIIEYSIRAALDSGVFAEVMVSTDDVEIATIAKQAGASVPFMRSERTSNDFATTADVLEEVLLQYRQIGKEFDYACCLYPTAPFITAKKVKEAYQQLVGQDADSILTVTAFSFPIWRSFRIQDGRVQYTWPEHAKTRSQDLPPAYHDCGQLYFFHVPRFLETKKLVSDNTLPLIVPESEAQDIDTLEDWKVAEIKFTFAQSKENG